MYPPTPSPIGGAVTVTLLLLLVNANKPHRTLLDFSGFNWTLEAQVLDPSKPNVSIGFLTNFQDIGTLLIGGAIPLAVAMVNSDPVLLPDHNLEVLMLDLGECDTFTPLRKMTMLREEKDVAAFLGFDSSCEHEALLAASWDMTMISHLCTDSKVSDKEKYPTFARTLPPSSKVCKSLISLLRHFEWQRLMLLVANDTAKKQVADVLAPLALDHDIDIMETFFIPADYLTKDNTTLKNIVMDTYTRTRVYVLLADYYVLVDMVRFMQEKGLLDNGDYVVISLEEQEFYDPNKYFQYITREFEVSHVVPDPVPFQSVLILCPGTPINPDYPFFNQLVLNYSGSDPFNIPYHPNIKVTVPIYGGLAYDAVMIYASALTDAMADNVSVFDGPGVFQYIKSRSYESILGFSMMIDEHGDAEGNYTVMALEANETNSSYSKMRPVARFTYQGTNDLPSFRLEGTINWISGKPPRSEPVCGFNHEKCENEPEEWTMVIVYGVCCFVTVVTGIFIFRHYHYEHKLACLLWKADIKDLSVFRSELDGDPQQLKNLEVEKERKTFLLKVEDSMTGRIQSKIGVYKGNAVYIYHVYKKNIDLTRGLRKEMIQIREMRHENINPFIGACVDPPNICILTIFCARGSLQDVLKNTDLHLDMMFIASLVMDLVKGMIYLHESDIVSHGNLKSSNCIVDSRWMLKITDFGLHEFRANQDPPASVQKTRSQSSLWRAPELLRDLNPPPRGTQKGDVYSFAIILFEIMGRIGPWGDPEPSVKYVTERVTNPQHYGGALYRPPVDYLSECPDYIRNCMRECWAEEPDDRPDFRLIKVKLRTLYQGLHTNIFDNMISIMEKYAYNLEAVVKDRTNKLQEEKKKTENLLLRMLPKPVAEQLLRGEKVEAESFDSVTIYFSDIVGFTSLSAISTPLQVVDLLNDLYTCFDSIIGHYDVYKVETIGDAYMVVSGLPIRNGNRHAGEVASLALRLREAIETFEIRHRPGDRLSLRIGINSGPCVAGVVGLKMPRYCLFGDTVNTASRMESTGEAMKIHVSEACKNILEKIGGYILQERGLVNIKGKGEMRTYWLAGKQVMDCESLQPHAPLHHLPDLLHDNFSSRDSCLSLFDDCRRHARNHVLRANGYRSAPTINFRQFYSPEQNLLF